LIYSATLLAAFEKFSLGIYVTSPFEPLMVFILAIFYVNDGMPGVNDALHETASPLPLLLDQAQNAAQSREHLLFVSGGALELSKCFAYAIYWDLSEGQHRMLEPHELPGSKVCAETSVVTGPSKLTYGDCLKDFHWLETVSPTTGRRTLGARIALAGNWTDEFQYRQGQAQELSLKIAGSAILS
jgi:hypothetical protein